MIGSEAVEDWFVETFLECLDEGLKREKSKYEVKVINLKRVFPYRIKIQIFDIF